MVCKRSRLWFVKSVFVCTCDTQMPRQPAIQQPEDLGSEPDWGIEQLQEHFHLFEAWLLFRVMCSCSCRSGDGRGFFISCLTHLLHLFSHPSSSVPWKSCIAEPEVTREQQICVVAQQLTSRDRNSPEGQCGKGHMAGVTLGKPILHFI